MKTYILQKDLPNAKAGAKYHITDNEETYVCCDALSTNSWDISYPKEYVENNPEWFKLKEENISVKMGLNLFDETGLGYCFTLSEEIGESKREAIRKAIEFIVNNGESKTSQ